MECLHPRFCYEVPVYECYFNAISKYSVVAFGKFNGSGGIICNWHVELSSISVGVNVGCCTLFMNSIQGVS